MARNAVCGRFVPLIRGSARGNTHMFIRSIRGTSSVEETFSKCARFWARNNRLVNQIALHCALGTRRFYLIVWTKCSTYTYFLDNSYKAKFYFIINFIFIFENNKIPFATNYFYYFSNPETYQRFSERLKNIWVLNKWQRPVKSFGSKRLPEVLGSLNNWRNWIIPIILKAVLILKP